MGTPQFTPEFKEDTVRQITERGYSVAEISDLLVVSAYSLIFISGCPRRDMSNLYYLKSKFQTKSGVSQ
ncbi:hypothetical protein GCM10009132_06830 [Serratia ureilytica]